MTAAVAAPLGTTTIVLQAKGKLGGADRVLDLPAVTLNVVPPASLELAAPAARDQAGHDGRAQGKDRPQGIVRCTRDRQDQRAPRRAQGRPRHRRRQGLELHRQSRWPSPKRRRPPPIRAFAMAFQVEKKDYSVAPYPLAVKVVAAK